MNIEYVDKDVKEIFEDLVSSDSTSLWAKRGLKGWNKDLAKKVLKRCDEFSEIENFRKLQDYHTGHMESLKGDYKGSYSIRVSANMRLIFKPKSEDLSAESLKECNTVIIIGVVDYHD